MNILSLFGGIECGYPAFIRNNINIENYYSCEIDENAKAISRYNIPHIQDMGNVFEADFKSLNNIDIVVGGSPCTYWSIIQKNRETTQDGEGYRLFMQYIRALKEVKPKYFIYENNYSIHQDIVNSITNELGVQPIMINSALLSGQQRKRLYWTNIPDISQPIQQNISVRDILEDNVDVKYYTHGEYTKVAKTKVDISQPMRIGHYNKGGQADRIYSIDGKSVNLIANGGGKGAKTGLYLLDNGDVRRLTPLEAERLQTLPDNWTKYGKKPNGDIFELSDNARLKGVGNGWTSDVIAHILRNI